MAEDEALKRKPLLGLSPPARGRSSSITDFLGRQGSKIDLAPSPTLKRKKPEEDPNEPLDTTYLILQQTRIIKEQIEESKALTKGPKHVMLRSLAEIKSIALTFRASNVVKSPSDGSQRTDLQHDVLNEAIKELKNEIIELKGEIRHNRLITPPSTYSAVTKSTKSAHSEENIQMQCETKTDQVIAVVGEHTVAEDGPIARVNSRLDELTGKIAIMAEAVKPTRPAQDTASYAMAVAAGSDTRQEWKQVTRKEKKPKQAPEASQKKVPNFETIAIRAEGVAYPDLIKRLKEAVNPAECNATVTAIRKTARETINISVKSGDGGAERLRDAVRAALGDDATVTIRGEWHRLIIRGLDVMATSEEVKEALKREFPENDAPEIVTLRKTYGDTQMALLRVQRDLAKKLLESGQIRIGWTTCKVREDATEIRCFRCWVTGHAAANCKGADRSNLCFNCGGKDHIAAGCAEPAKCIDCGGDHRTGARTCPERTIARNSAPGKNANENAAEPKVVDMEKIDVEH